MSGSIIHFPKAGPMVAAVALVATTLLGGCSGRDVAGAEKLAAINAAADRAEKAATRAEAAATKAEKAAQPVVVEAEPEDLSNVDEPTTPSPAT